MTPFDLTDSSHLVTGASLGIGQEICRAIAQAGGHVFAVARNEERLRALVEQLPGDGHAFATADLSDIEHLPKLVPQWVEEHGTFDGLVHAAGIQSTTPLRTLDLEEYERMWRINVTAGLFLAKAFAKQKNPGKGASIVFLSSVAAHTGQPARSGYASTKGAVSAMARSLAVELARKQIRVNCLAPGLVQTAMLQEMRDKMSDTAFAAIESEYPLGLGLPSDVAHAAQYLLSDAARWITGTSLVMDGGFSAR